jgi:hypothetical protein
VKLGELAEEPGLGGLALLLAALRQGLLQLITKRVSHANIKKENFLLKNYSFLNILLQLLTGYRDMPLESSGTCKENKVFKHVAARVRKHSNCRFSVESAL